MPRVIPTSEAADRLGCTTQAVINAIRRGDLNAERLGHAWAVHDDAKLAAYAVPERGGRTHAAYRERQEADAGADGA